jgi:hypothetical protein
MKSLAFTQWIAVFVVGALIGGASVVFINHGRDKETATQSAKDCERDIDLGLAHTLMDAVPLHAKVLQLMESNQLQEAQTDLCLYAMTEMKSAWDINEHYKGALDEDLTPLLLRDYPVVRRVVGVSSFARLPQSALLEMSNFMADADSIVETERKTSGVVAAGH